MLDSFIEVSYAHETRMQLEKEAVALLKQLPADDLLKLASGQKLAWMDAPCGPGGSNSFLDKYKGTPLFDEALALEQEELQAEMTSIEKRKEQRQSQQDDNGIWELQDQLRIKKRLLDLRLAQEEAGMAAGAAGGAPPSPVVAEAAGADVAGADAAPVGALKTAGIADKARTALSGAKGAVGRVAAKGARALDESYTMHPRSTMAAAGGALGAGSGALEGHLRRDQWKQEAKKHPDSKGWQHAAKHPVRHGALTGAAGTAAASALGTHFGLRTADKFFPGQIERSRAFVRRDQALRHAKNSVEEVAKHAEFKPSKQIDEWGRELARADFHKAAEAVAFENAAKEAGTLLAKEGAGLGGLATMASTFAKNPKNLGTLVGAGTGALGGLSSGLRKDESGQRHLLGGLAQGAAGGAVGALGGHAAQNIGASVRSGTPLASAAKQYGVGWGNKIKNVASSMQPKAPAQLSV